MATGSMIPEATASHLIKPNLRRAYPQIATAKGIYLYDTEGRRYIDGCSGAIVTNIGHGVTEVVEAMRRQAEQVAFVYRTQFTSAVAEQLADRLVVRAPGDLDGVFFVNSGSEGTETAARLAVQYFRERGQSHKVKVLGRQMSYHGMTLGALSMSGHAERRRDSAELLHNFAQAPQAHCYRCPFSLEPRSCDLACANAWEEAILSADPTTVAAVIAEPVVGAAGGAVPAPEGYFRRLRALCDRYDILLIADEVMTGMGRTGAWFGCDHEGVVPDLLVLGKGMSAGYTPMSAVLMRRHIVEAMRTGSGVGCFGHTYSANPLSAATCLAVMDYIEAHDLIQNAAMRGQELRAGLEALMARHAIIGDVRGRGLLLGMELVADRQSKRPFAPAVAIAAQLVQDAFAQGLVIYPAGGPTVGDSVLIAPPLTITAAQVGELLQLLDQALATLQARLQAASSTHSSSQ